MEKLLCILTFLLFFFTKINSQADVPKRVHSVSLGIISSFTALKDETVSPLIFSGFTFPLDLTYRRESALSKHAFQLFYQSFSLTSRNNFILNQESGGLMYSYLRRVKSWGKANLFVGGEIQIQGFRRSYNPAANTNNMMLLNAFNLTGLVDYSLENHKFEAQAAFTGIGYNIRPQRNFYDNTSDNSFKTFISSGAFESIPDYLNVSLRLSYQPPTTSKHIRWRFDYLGHFHRFQQQQYLGVLQNQFRTSFTYQF